MELNVVSSLFSKRRRHQFLLEYIKHNSTNKTVHYVGGPMGGLAGNAGHDFGRGMRAWIAVTKIMSDSVLKSVTKRVLLFFMFILLAGFSGEISPILGIGVFLVFLAYLFVPPLFGKLDFRKHKKLRKKLGPPEKVDEAISHLSARHPETRLVAMRAIHDVSQESPGRLLKNTSHDRESLATTLVEHLSEPNEDLSQVCSGAIKWLARDHGEMFIPHVKTIAQYLESSHAGIQSNIAIAIGNIAQFDPDHRPAYAKALTPAAEDLDSEVREAAAIALGTIHCPESMKMLKYLINNETSPDVIEEAKNSLNKIQANTAQ